MAAAPAGGGVANAATGRVTQLSTAGVARKPPPKLLRPAVTSADGARAPPTSVATLRSACGAPPPP